MVFANLKSGFHGIIESIAGGSPAVVQRLHELGFSSGQSVSLCGRAPFGGPLVVQVRGTAVALRPEEAACIRLR